MYRALVFFLELKELRSFYEFSDDFLMIFKPSERRKNLCKLVHRLQRESCDFTHNVIHDCTQGILAKKSISTLT